MIFAQYPVWSKSYRYPPCHEEVFDETTRDEQLGYDFRF
jgi:hypothetical protein